MAEPPTRMTARDSLQTEVSAFEWPPDLYGFNHVCRTSWRIPAAWGQQGRKHPFVNFYQKNEWES